ncbi:isoflavone reductase family protein [Didymella exigua CBS 183.55]|uniref:Isoflavone reductase family protein n=1 Tax=Didymella exigua CBS 183.55 TaxID=1150837 RepID=A0A6A5RE49_9PLEO|nr:isoflavone reductase family protein [Didymella exigua CBS 183.55]KAF1925498.1 isoflavone reductase family protein [Didymella exigua CBS 183.55]
MAIEKVMIIGNWELCLSIINALKPADKGQLHSNLQLSVLTKPSQWLHLPPHLSTDAVSHQKSDFSPASLESALAGQDLVISTTAGGDSDQQIRIIDAAIAAGVRGFVPHEFGHDTLNKGVSSRVAKSGGRAKVIEYLREACKKTAGFEWVGVATGYTLDTGLISGNMGVDMEWHSATLHGTGTETFAASSLQRVGQVVARVIVDWDEVANQYIYAAGTLTSANEVLRSAEKTTQREFTVGNYDVEDCIKEGEARIQRGYPDSGMFLLERSILYDEGLDAAEPFQRCSSNKLLQLESESVETIVANAYHELRHHGKPGCGCSW